ncbi:unnamed protein product, partial [Meganyctiphanes norvegica]
SHCGALLYRCDQLLARLTPERTILTSDNNNNMLLLRTNLLAPLCRRALMTSAVQQKLPGVINPGYIKIREKYVQFQIDNGKLVHLRGGPFDNLLFAITVSVCGIGLCMCFKVYWDLAWPRKPQ